ncbi:MAG: hypothetical protein RR315_04705, partial [Oscillospiraceae bacterium]
MREFFACLLTLALIFTLNCPTHAMIMPKAEIDDNTEQSAKIDGDDKNPPITENEEAPPPSMGGCMLPPGIGGTPPEEEETFEITGLSPLPSHGEAYEPLTLAPNESIGNLAGKLPSELLCEATNTMGSLFCPVAWDLSESISTAASGRMTINGKLNPPQNCT